MTDREVIQELNSYKLVRNCGYLPQKCAETLKFCAKCFHPQCVQKVAVHLQKVLEVMSTSIYTGLNLFNFIHKHFLQICVRKVTVHLQKVLEVMSTSVYTGLNCSLSAQRLSECTVF
jgi:hypothetical protein